MFKTCHLQTPKILQTDYVNAQLRLRPMKISISLLNLWFCCAGKVELVGCAVRWHHRITTKLLSVVNIIIIIIINVSIITTIISIILVIIIITTVSPPSY